MPLFLSHSIWSASFSLILSGLPLSLCLECLFFSLCPKFPIPSHTYTCTTSGTLTHANHVHTCTHTHIHTNTHTRTVREKARQFSLRDRDKEKGEERREHRGRGETRASLLVSHCIYGTLPPLSLCASPPLPTGSLTFSCSVAVS